MSQRSTRSTNSGFALLNALIGATVLAIGLLGNATLMVHSLQTSRLALQRTLAVALAADMADRLRANSIGSTSFALPPDVTLATPASPCTAVDHCGPQQVAATELYSWQQFVMRALPNAQTAISVATVAESTANQFTITIRWVQSGDGAAASITLTVQA